MTRVASKKRNMSSVTDYLEKEIRVFIAGMLPGRFPRLYSTLDTPTLKVPLQVAAYQLAVRKCIQPGDHVLDVGFGLGYGMVEMAKKAERLTGIEIDRRAVSRGAQLVEEVPQIVAVKRYDGQIVPYDDNSFEVVTCVDVLEHVPDYVAFLQEMVRVSSRVVLVSTPNRRREYTRPDGRPKNRWHLREWSFQQLDAILQGIPDVRVDWNFLDGPWEGPFECSPGVSEDTMAVAPALMLDSSRPCSNRPRAD